MTTLIEIRSASIDNTGRASIVSDDNYLFYLIDLKINSLRRRLKIIGLVINCINYF